MSFTKNKVEFYNNKSYDEKFHAYALGIGIPNFIVNGFDYENDTITSGSGINGGTFGVLGDTAEIQNITPNFTGYLIWKVTLNNLSSVSEVYEASVKIDTPKGDNSNIKEFTLYKITNGVVDVDYRHIEYVKELKFEQGPSGAGYFVMVLNGFESNEFSVAGITGQVISVDGKIPKPETGNVDINLTFARIGFDAVIADPVDFQGNLIEIFTLANAESPNTPWTITAELSLGASTENNFDRSWEAWHNSKNEFENLGGFVGQIKMSSFNKNESTNSNHANDMFCSIESFQDNRGFNFKLATGLVKGYRNEKGELGDNYNIHESELLTSDYVGLFMGSSQGIYTSEIVIPNNFYITKVNYIWSQFDDVNNLPLSTANTLQVVEDGSIFNGTVFLDNHTSGQYDPLMITMGSNNADPTLPGNIKSLSLKGHKIDYTTKRLTVSGSRYEDNDGSYRKIILNKISIRGKYVNYQPTSLNIHMQKNQVDVETAIAQLLEIGHDEGILNIEKTIVEEQLKKGDL